MTRGVTVASRNYAMMAPMASAGHPFAAASTTSSLFSSHSHHRMWMSTSVEVPPPPTSNHEHTPLAGAQGSIIYTETDEAPALATYSLYPVIKKVRLCCQCFCCFSKYTVCWQLSRRLPFPFHSPMPLNRIPLYFHIYILVWCISKY